MSYSEQTTYGRKVIKGNRKKLEYQRLLYTSWYLCFIVGLITGLLVFWGISSVIGNESDEPVESSTTEVETEFHGVIEQTEFNNDVLLVDWGGSFIPLDVPMGEDMQEYIYCLSSGYGVEFSFVMALIEHESSFLVDVVSNTNDHGLMQINSINHAWLSENLGISDFLDPHQNIKSGIFILSQLFEKYEDPSRVLMAYNMGERGARRLWEKGIFESEYSNSIMEQAAEYQKQLSEKRGEQ